MDGSPPRADARIMVTVQDAPFDPGALLSRFCEAAAGCGAAASFTGLVRGDGCLTALDLQHLPRVTETALRRIAGRAAARWGLRAALIVHRTGRMTPGEAIVFVAAAAPHRRAAINAAEFMIDVLKTEAPFWKKETRPDGEKWIEPTEADAGAAARWLEKE